MSLFAVFEAAKCLGPEARQEVEQRLQERKSVKAALLASENQRKRKAFLASEAVQKWEESIGVCVCFLIVSCSCLLRSRGWLRFLVLVVHRGAVMVLWCSVGTLFRALPLSLVCLSGLGCPFEFLCVVAR